MARSRQSQEQRHGITNQATTNRAWDRPTGKGSKSYRYSDAQGHGRTARASGTGKRREWRWRRGRREVWGAGESWLALGRPRGLESISISVHVHGLTDRASQCLFWAGLGSTCTRSNLCLQPNSRDDVSSEFRQVTVCFNNSTPSGIIFSLE